MLKRNTILVFFASTFLIFFAKISFAESFMCTKYGNVNFRNGPGVKFAVIYKVMKKGYPVKVIDTIEGWHAVEDFKGEKMWISSVNLASKCGKIVKFGQSAEVKIRPEDASFSVLTLEEGFVIHKVKCYERWCEVEIENKTGWILKEKLWG